MGSDDNDIMAGVFNLPRTGLLPEAVQHTGMGASVMTTSINSIRTDLESRAAAGDEVAAAVMRLMPDWTIDEIQMQDDLEAEITPRLVYGSATVEFDTGRRDRAVARLSSLLNTESGRADALCGLAVVSAMDHHYEDALLFANKSIELEVTNPRALCIAGFCELRRGNRKVAQSLLARVARIARKLPEFREDLRAAQRMLLNLHFN